MLLIAASLFFCSGLFWRCANISPTGPQGGPKDTIPPKMVRATPRRETTDFTAKSVYIEFDEYVQLKEQQQEFFTSPLMAKKPTLSIKNKGVLVEITSPLEENTTYALNFGKSIVDHHESNPATGFTYAFSTGPTIDSMLMSGAVANAETADTVKNAFLFFFDTSHLVRGDGYDSTIFRARAAAVGRTMPNGTFVHEHLKPIDYQVYAMIDNNGNEIYDPGVDHIGFLDSTHNPARMPSFRMWYDSTLMYTVAEPQIFLKTFVEKAFRRNSLSDHKRPGPQQLMLRFSAEYPVIESLRLNGVDSSALIREYARVTRDSIFYWINRPKTELPDTITGEITYLAHDSTGTLLPRTQELKFIHTPPKTADNNKKDDQARAERPPREGGCRFWPWNWGKRKAPATTVAATADSMATAAPAADSAATARLAGDSTLLPGAGPLPADSLVADTAQKETLKTTINAGSPLMPYDRVDISFDLPLAETDLTGIALTRTDARNARHTATFTVERDTMSIRRYVLSSDWRRGEKYQLLIPAGAFCDINGVANDTLRQEFTVAEADKYASITVNLTGTTPGYNYIIQVIEEKAKSVAREMLRTQAGKNTIEFVPPGNMRVRLIEDRNANGRWDPGDVVRRRMPERVEFYFDPPTKKQTMLTRINWDVAIDIDASTFFEPKPPVHHEAAPDASESDEERTGHEQPMEENAAVETEHDPEVGRSLPEEVEKGQIEE
ncbi:MAG: Ig-like domain-containing protein [Rikenellaceae bacterium]|jgi:hypothetical protein|nr:Ig-like domain-containing protein [Rikenellaceae bacterium]